MKLADHSTSGIGLPELRIKSEETVVWSIKWIASVAQILGYAATAFGATPLNIYLFLFGLVGWFAVGVLWNDRAIMMIHVIALGAMLVGLAGG